VTTTDEVIDLRQAADTRSFRTLAHSIVIPAYNEQDRLPRAMAALADHLDPASTEVIVVDDGSTDATAAVADELLAGWPHGRRISLDRNRGKGRAVRTGVLASTARMVAFVDADSATDARCLHDLFSALDTADVAIGSRALSESVIEQYNQDRALMGRAFNVLVRKATGVPWRDTQCGFKAFRTPVAKLLFAMGTVEGFAFDVEVLDLVHRLGLRAVEVPVRWQHVEGSKVRHMRDSIDMTLDVVRASRADRRTPIECLRLNVPGGRALIEVLLELPDGILVSQDRGTLELVVPPGGSHDRAVALDRLAEHGIDIDPVIRSGRELLDRCCFGQLSTTLPETSLPAARSPEPATPLESARHALHRGLRQGRQAMGRRPLTLPILLGLTPLGVDRRIDGRTELVVEGFPRTGSTFVATALEQATRGGLSLVSPVNQPAQVGRAVRQGVPTLVLVRRPVDTLASYLCAAPHGRPRGVLREYIGYHRELIPFLDDVEIADFDQVTSDLRPVLERLRTRFSLGIPEFDHTDRSVRRIFTVIEDQHLRRNKVPDCEATMPRPSAHRSAAKAAHREALEHPGLAALLAEAEHLHGLFLAAAASR
jgi:hypothetical protein